MNLTATKPDTGMAHTARRCDTNIVGAAGECLACDAEQGVHCLASEKPEREPTRDEALYQRNLENFARRFAAKKMGLVKDPQGQDLPDDLWQQCIPQAERALSFEVTNRDYGYNHTTVTGTCPADATVQEVKDRFYHDYFGGRDAWVRDGRFGCTIHAD